MKKRLFLALCAAFILAACDAHASDTDFPWPPFLLLEVVLRRTNRGTRYQLRDQPLPPTCPFLGRPIADGNVTDVSNDPRYKTRRPNDDRERTEV